MLGPFFLGEKVSEVNLVFDISNGLWINTIFPSDKALGPSICSDGKNLTFRERGRSMVRVCVRTATKSSFLHAILHIVFLRSEKQMERINARACIALVENVHTLGDWPYVKNPCRSMRLLGDVRFWPEFPVAICANFPHPQPASGIWLRHDLFFKSFFEGLSGILTFRHVNPPCRVDVLRPWAKVALRLRLLRYSAIKILRNIISGPFSFARHRR